MPTTPRDDDDLEPSPLFSYALSAEPRCPYCKRLIRVLFEPHDLPPVANPVGHVTTALTPKGKTTVRDNKTRTEPKKSL